MMKVLIVRFCTMFVVSSLLLWAKYENGPYLVNPSMFSQSQGLIYVPCRCLNM